MYYNTNAIYEYLNNKNIANFEYCYGNMWQLVYGDGNCDPKLLMVVSGVESENLNKELSPGEKSAFFRMEQIHNLTNTPVGLIRFAVDEEAISNVNIYIPDKNKFRLTDLNQLANRFCELGLPINPNIQENTGKYLNDKESSAYHKWQRNTLGSSLKVSDIDLIKIDLHNDKIQEIYELKRSIISLSKWEPYKDDYNNFILLAKLLGETDIQLKIIYNVRTKNPWNDDISKLKIFNISYDHTLDVFHENTITLEEFFSII